MHSFTTFQTRLLQDSLSAGKACQGCSSYRRACAKPSHVICQAQHAQRSSKKASEAPSLDLKELEKAFSKEGSARTRESTADERIAFINSSASPKTGSSARRPRGKKEQSPSVGPVRQRGSKNGKPSKDATERLSKVVARAGIASRRRAEDLICEGKVKVNGNVVLVPQHQVLLSGADKSEGMGPIERCATQITVNGKELPRTTQPFYFAVNKPKGYLCANVPNKDGTTKLVVDLFEEWRDSWKAKHPQPTATTPRLFTVGRLDVASTGLIFVTNDGIWAQKVQHPSSGLTKEYVVTCSQPPTRQELEKVADGCEVDGTFVRPVAVAPIREPGRRPGIRVVIAEGRNREVRTLVANAGLTVDALKRVRIGGYRLPRSLGIGAFEALKPNEVRRITDLGAQENNASVNPFFAAYAL